MHQWKMLKSVLVNIDSTWLNQVYVHTVQQILIQTGYSHSTQDMKLVDQIQANIRIPVKQNIFSGTFDKSFLLLESRMIKLSNTAYIMQQPKISHQQLMHDYI